MVEKASTPDTAPSLSPRLKILQMIGSRMRRDCDDLVKAGSRELDLTIDPPAHYPGNEGESLWSDAELAMLAGSFRKRYAAAGADVAVTAVNGELDSERQIAALLAEERAEPAEQPASIGATLTNVNAMQATTPDMPAAQDVGKKPATSAKINDSSEAAAAILKKMWKRK